MTLVRTVLLVGVALGIASGAAYAGPAQDAGAFSPEVDCGKWSLKGLRLGMPLAEFLEAHPKAKHGKNWFRADDRGRAWYLWVENRMRGVYNYVLPERDDPNAPIVSIVALIDVTETSPSSVIEALVRRWGTPVFREVEVTKVRYFNAFGAPRGEFDWKATTWEDQACDLVVTAFEKNTLSPATTLGLLPYDIKVTLMTVSLDSFSKEITRTEQQRKNREATADDAVRP